MKKEVDLDKLLSIRWLNRWVWDHQWRGGEMTQLGLAHAIAAAIRARGEGMRAPDAAIMTATMFPDPQKRRKLAADKPGNAGGPASPASSN